MTCDHCNGPGNKIEGQCCWAKEEIKKFRKQIFKRYICEVLFEMIISISSVVTDIISLVFYITTTQRLTIISILLEAICHRHVKNTTMTLKFQSANGKWVLAVFTALPVILPTTVFTNVYLSNKYRSYNSLSSQKVDSSKDSSALTKTNDENLQGDLQSDLPLEHDGGKCFNSRICCRSFYQSFCDKDMNISKGGKRVVKKYFRRFAKYCFGTLVLRFIAWTWYLKAIIFGYEAIRAPKKYMKMAKPDSHWSYELLIRLDFLQAALENAPQCVIQLVTLLTDSTEAKALGLLTLGLSFIDFVRVATAVQWNIGKGPVVAPTGCYGSALWKLINTCSWILLYSARSCALALVMATSKDWTIVYIVGGFILLHMLLFAKLFSSTKYGVAAQKVIVTAFISIFFLPELDSEQVDILIQFYYAALLLENTLFIIPWKGIKHVYCESLMQNGGSRPKANMNVYSGIMDSSTPPSTSNCLIQPVLIVLVVPAFTVLGIILRLAAARRAARFKASNPDTDKPMTMEERVASIYNRKWTKLTYRDLLSAFGRMLRKEVSPKNLCATNDINIPKNKSTSRSNSILLISGTLGEDLMASQTFIKKSFSMIVRYKELDETEINRPQSQVEKRLTFPLVKDPVLNPFTHLENSYKVRQQFQDDLEKDEKGTVSTVPKSFFVPALAQNSTSSGSGVPIFRNLEVKMLKVESPEGEIVELDYWM